MSTSSLLRSGAAAALLGLAAVAPVSAQSSALVPTGLDPQTISFTAPTGVVVGRDLSLVATATSGLTVTFASSTTLVCQVSGTTLTPVSDGTCLVTAYQNGNGTWAPAPPVQVTIAVAPSTWYAGMRQSFWIAGEERFSIPIIVASGTRVTMKLHLSPSMPGQLVEVWWQVGTGSWAKLTTRYVESATGAASYSFTAWRKSVAYRWRFPGNATYQSAFSAARRVYAR